MQLTINNATYDLPTEVVEAFVSLQTRLNNGIEAYKELKQQATDLRKAQQAYYAHPSREKLTKAKEIEKDFDLFLSGKKKSEITQSELFR